MTCPICSGKRTLQNVYDECDPDIDKLLCNSHARKILSMMQKEADV